MGATANVTLGTLGVAVGKGKYAAAPPVGAGVPQVGVGTTVVQPVAAGVGTTGAEPQELPAVPAPQVVDHPDILFSITKLFEFFI